jgi:hypothetical protein
MPDEPSATSALLKADQIYDQAARLRSLSFPSETPQLFASSVCDLCEGIKTKVIPWLRSDGDEDLLKWISLFLVDTIGPMLDFIDGATSENTPAKLVLPLEEVGESALPGSRFILARQWRYNYSVIELRQVIEPALRFLPGRATWQTILKWLPGPLYAISFPSLERDNALLHVNFAHELGHPFAADFLQAENPATVLSELTREIKREISKPDVVEQALDIGKTTVLASRLREKAVEEVISDAVSAHVFGPSALFALEEVAGLSASMDDIAEDLHPPWRYRLRHMLTALRELQFIGEGKDGSLEFKSWPERVPPVIQGVKGKADKRLRDLQELVSQEEDWKRIRENVSAKCAYESIERILLCVRTFVAGRVAGRYSETLFKEEVPDLLHRLYLHLPPNQIEPRAGPAKSVNLYPSGEPRRDAAGWH